MATEKSFTEKTSAGKTSIGFDYQHYYFLYRVLKLGLGQSVGLEIKDDVHTSLDDDFNVLYQLKHTIQTGSAGLPTALSELDADLWKTLYNWSRVITDETDGRKDVASQREFIARTNFHLVSNKSLSKSNELLRLLSEFHDTGDFEPLGAHLTKLYKKTQDAAIKSYIESVNGLDGRVKEEFLANVRLELEVDGIIDLVKKALREKIIDADQVDAVFERLDSGVRSDNFLAVKGGGALSISFEEFATRYGKIFKDARNRKLVTYRFEPVLPDDIFAQRFVKRLVEIGAIKNANSEQAVDYTRQKIRLSLNLQRWIQEGDVVSDEVEEFHDEVFARWSNEFNGLFDRCSSINEIIDCAVDLLRLLRRERFSLSGTELGTLMSNGELYYLSDVGRIGWHRDWADND